MGFFRGVLLGSGWAIGSFLCSRLDAQAPPRLEPTHAASGAIVSTAVTDETPAYGAPESTAEGVLKEMASRAAVVFTGTVSAVKMGPVADLGSNASASMVEVDFAVDQAVRGVSAGSAYVMREWAGLWRDSPRFVVGQRVLMLLHATGPGGLSSPVDGLDGAIPIKPNASTADTSLTALTASASDTPPQEDSVDMRWLQAKTLRSPAIADVPTASPGESFSGGLISTQNLGASAASTQITSAASATSTKLSRVLGLLLSWQETQDASH